MKPLTTWSCDSCGERVTPERGTVIARYTGPDRWLTGFLIVHKNIDGLDCDPGSRNGYYYNLDLDSLLGQRGMAHLLAHLSVGPLKGGGSAAQVADMDEFVDLFRRLQVPFYEEARHRFDDEDVANAYSDANEYFPYMPNELEKIAATERIR